MEAYKFETTIQPDGVIQIPEISQFANREVDVFILFKPQPAANAPDPQTIQSLLDNLRGILKNVAPDTHASPPTAARLF